MKRIILLANLAFSINAFAQLPSYVPSNGLQGWWEFNGNANDGSVNANNGTVNGATLTTDRFGNINAAYSFNGINNYIDCGNISSLNNSSALTISAWINYSSIVTNSRIVGAEIASNSNYGWSLALDNYYSNNALKGVIRNSPTQSGSIGYTGPVLQAGVTYYTVMVYNGTANYNADRLKLYINGVNQSLTFADSIPTTLPTTSFNTIIGGVGGSATDAPFDGTIDDIGIWNRALNQQEITDLYNAINCYNNTAITPTANSLIIGSTATFSATTSDSNPSYVWQSDFGQGFQTLNNFGNYNGTNTGTLNIANVQLPNHTQPIRVITTSGNCVDTSNVSIITILDTCITNVTVYDTLLTTVTDTLLINAIITGLNPPNNLNTIKVFPNPASTHITIDYGNFNAMSGYTLTIVNSIGQTVFTTPINQQTSYIDLSTWTGIGIYFVQLVDSQNNTIENRKIVIQ